MEGEGACMGEKGVGNLWMLLLFGICNNDVC